MSGSREACLLKALAHARVATMLCNADGRVLWAQNIPSELAPTSIIGRTLGEFLPEEVTRSCEAAQRSALATGETCYLDIFLQGDEAAASFTFCIDFEGGGNPPAFLITALDVTDQKRREETLRALLREVAHRSKNMLAIIQSIAAQTGLHAETVDVFLARFRGRLHSLASTQDLVTSSDWRGADLRDLAMGQVGGYVSDPRASLRLEGLRPYLTPNAALYVGLALHELAVNSVSYGALRDPGGHVTIEARQAENGKSQPGLILTWLESTGVADTTLGKKRFGSIALERVVPAALDGQAELAITSNSLHYRLEVPPLNYTLS